jgi:hypothetical protein
MIKFKRKWVEHISKTILKGHNSALRKVEILKSHEKQKQMR